MKIVFFGSDDFAAEHLKRLMSEGQEVLAVVTGPDKPQGRGMKLAASVVKQMAVDNRIPCLQPVSLKDKEISGALKGFNADIFVVVAYGRLLTREILDIPKMLCMNVHGSLLPKYRGAAPINWAILNGEKETGVTIQKMALELDSGDIIARQAITIGPDENAGALRGRMAKAGAELLAEVLNKYPDGKFPFQPQDENQVTYAPKLTKDMGRIAWKKPAQVIANQVRGLAPWPGTGSSYQGKAFKITQVQLSEESGTAGEVIKIGKEGFCVACGKGSLLIKEVHPEAGKLMPASSFVAGYKISPGALIGA